MSNYRIGIIGGSGLYHIEGFTNQKWVKVKTPFGATSDDFLTGKLAVSTISFQETASGGAFSWHTAPARQLVITLSGTLDFQTRDGEHFLLHPGDILFAEDTVGSGHSWKLTDDSSWRRAYVILQPEAAVPFLARKRQRVKTDANAD